MKDKKLIRIPRVFEVYVDGVKVNECPVDLEYPYSECGHESHHSIYDDVVYEYHQRGYEKASGCMGGSVRYDILFSEREKKAVCVSGKVRFAVTDANRMSVYEDSVLRPVAHQDDSEEDMCITQGYYDHKWYWERRVTNVFAERRREIKSLKEFKTMVVVR